MEVTKTSRRIYELDSLRGFAAVMVILFHYTTKYGEIFKSSSTTVYEFRFGHYGVSLFFMISGFVIFMTVHSIKSPFAFVYKRFIRLYPIFWICMTLTFVVTYFSNVSYLSRTFADYLVNFTMIASLLGFKTIDGAYWSLVPELFFYALIFFLIAKRWIRYILPVCFLWLGISFVSLLVNLPAFISVVLNLKYGFLFIAGINFYQISIKQDNWINHFQLFVCLLFCYFQGDIILTYFFIFFLALFYALAKGRLKFLKLRILIFLGEISYVLYLVHQFIGYVIINKLLYYDVGNFYVLIIIPLIVSILLASFLTYIVERPIIRSANNLFKKYYKEAK